LDNLLINIPQDYRMDNEIVFLGLPIARVYAYHC